MRDLFARTNASFLFPARSAVVAHHAAPALSLARVAIGQYGREFLESSYCFLTQGRRFACDACLTQAFDVSHAVIKDGVGNRRKRLFRANRPRRENNVSRVLLHAVNERSHWPAIVGVGCCGTRLGERGAEGRPEHFPRRDEEGGEDRS